MMEGMLDEYKMKALVFPVLRLFAAQSEDANGLFSVCYACVSHFYTDLPYGDGETPTTPNFSMVEFDSPASDHRKEKAQQKWITLTQMTPTRLVI